MRYRLLVAIMVMLAPATALAGGLVRVGEQPAVVVRFDPGVSAAERAQAFSSVGATDHDPVADVPRVHSVTLPRGTSTAAAIRSLEANPNVAWAEPDARVHALVVPNDPLFGGPGMWGLASIGATTAWDTITGTGNVNVGVVDTGISPTHPDLAANVRPALSQNFVQRTGALDPAAWQDLNGHGTHVAGTIGAVGNNGLGIAGVTWGSGLVSARALDLTGQGIDSEVAAGLGWAGAHARVVNASLGGGTQAALQAAVLANPNTLYVFAAGNGGADGVGDNNDLTPVYPCSIPLANVICVAALDVTNALAPFSNYGRTSVDLGAPGVGIESSWISLTPMALPALTTWTQDPAGSWLTGTTSVGTPDVVTNGTLTGTATNPAGALTVLSLPSPLGALNGTACRLDYAAAARLSNGSNSFVMQVQQTPSGPWTTVDGPWTGNTGGQFVTNTVDLSAYDGVTGLRVRFVLQGTGGTFGLASPRPYLALTNVSVQCMTPQPVDGVYVTESGTSMAAPHVAGAAALLFSARPDLTVAQVKNALLSTATPTASLAGKTVTDGRLNVAAALASLTSLPPPPPVPPTPTPIANPGGGSGPGALSTPTAGKGTAPTPMTLTLRTTGPAQARAVGGRVRLPVKCVGTTADICVVTITLRYRGRTIGTLITSVRVGSTAIRTVVLTAAGRAALARAGAIDVTVRTTPRQGARGRTGTTRLRITRG